MTKISKKKNVKKIKSKDKETKEKEVKVKKKGKVRNAIVSIILVGAIALVSLILVFALYIIISSPDFDKDKLYSNEASIIYYADGTELAKVGETNRTLVTYDELPQVLVDAIVATEDSRFFQHSGVDLARFLKASIQQILGNSSAGGASTLTMQVVKNTYTSTDSTGLSGIIRKFTDVYMAVFKVESNYTKEEIMEFYVNYQRFAGDGSITYSGISGVEEACQYFFGKSVSDISLAEASLIAGMFQAPSAYNPYNYPEAARKRQKTVLQLMVNHGYITEDEMNAVLEIPIESLLVERESNTDTNVKLVNYIVSEVEEDTGYNAYYTPIKIYTTIDKDIQNVVTQVQNGELYDFPDEYIQEGIAITSIEDGSIVALSQGRDVTNGTGTNWATTAERQIGSTAKILFDYGPYIEYLNGSPATLLLDEATTYSDGTSIKNSDGTYYGLITMRKALVNSRNIPALRAFQAVYAEDPNYIIDFVTNLGINLSDGLYESDSIGGHTLVSPLQMSAAYAAFGRGGYYIEPYIYTKVEVIDTDELIEYKYEKVKVMSEETAYMITDMLISAAESGVGGTKVSGTEIAAKSGTTNHDASTIASKGYASGATRDAWAITYTAEYSTALWLGYESNLDGYYLTTSSGNKMRNAIMSAIGTRIYSKNVTFTVPSGIISVKIESETIPIQLPSEYTPSSMITTEIFKEGTEPTEVSTRYSKLATPTNGSYTTSGSTITLSWTSIDTPDAINTSYLLEYFNTYYDNVATKYYEKRISYNNSNIGTLGYNIYVQNSDGSLTYLGRTEGTTYTITNPTGGSVNYVIKSAYSIFTSNMSDGLTISTNITISSDDNETEDTTTETNTTTNTNTGLE